MRVLCMLAIAACYSPAAQEGLPCAGGVGGACPPSQSCDPNGLCYLHPGGADAIGSDSGNGRDAAIDAPVAPPMMLTLGLPGVYTYDTDTAVLLDPNGATVMHGYGSAMTPDGQAAALLVVGLTIGAASTLRASGNAPLVISASNTVRLDGTIDVGAGGAGRRTNCVNAAMVGGANFGGGGGGGGGGYGAAGGKGGDGNSNATVAPGGTGGTSAAIAPLSGGCPGANGGMGEDAGGAGGAGGGVAYVVSATSIAIAGTIQAGGSGGKGGVNAGAGFGDAGGGGGGSGGVIKLSAPNVMITGVLAANGGGGGAGSAFSIQGDDGQNGRAAASAASGGMGHMGASAGATGGYLDSPAGSDETAPVPLGGGGGGGGGVGYVAIDSAMTSLSGATISPAP